MEEVQKLRFVCKLCNKKYPCGKSLGGHMRSHVIGNSAESEKKNDANVKKITSLSDAGPRNFIKESEIVEIVNGQSNYGLRENPKKTWRAVDSSFCLPQEKVCKQCGKGFQSMKALCGHMACHSEKDKGLKDDQSWTCENMKLVLDSHSDTEAEDRMLRTRSSKSKRYNKLIVKAPYYLANNDSSSVSEMDGQDQEEVAMCLMLLSMDSGNKGGVNSVVESSDNNSVVLETKSSSIDMKTGRKEDINHIHNQDGTSQIKKVGDGKIKDSGLDAEIPQMENSDSGYFLGECAKVESDVSVDGFYKYGTFGECNKFIMNIDRKGEEYGDRFRKRMNEVTGYRTELREELMKENRYIDDAGLASNSVRIESQKRKYGHENTEFWNGSDRKMKNATPDPEANSYPKKKSKYECLNCKKTFKSYQALGGHRPCHKRSNAYESVYESGENNLDDSTDFRTNGKLGEGASKRKLTAKNSSQYAAKKLVKPKKNKGHVCPFCQRVFKNGQALGGHKRSHFIGGHVENINESPVMKPKLPDLLDLNLPAPEADEDNGHCQFFSM